MTIKVRTLILIFLCITLFGCVTSISDSLPYAKVPEILVATDVTLVASPSHPAAYLSIDSIRAGESVRVVGTDKSAAWLFVLHNKILGWMPTFYSRTNIATLKPAIVVDPLSDKCAKYLGSTFDVGEPWTSPISGSIDVVGSIFRPRVGKQFADASLKLMVKGQGDIIGSNYIHIPLTSQETLILFAFSLHNLKRNSQISFELAKANSEQISFQTVIFSNDCSNRVNVMPSMPVDNLLIGKLKTSLATPPTSQPEKTSLAKGMQPTPKHTTTPLATPTPVVVVVTKEISDVPENNLIVGSSWRTNHLEFELDHVEFSTTDVNTKFYVTNRGNTAVSFEASLDMGYFVLTDNKGRAWAPIHMFDGNVTLAPGEVSEDLGPRFDGKLLRDPEVTELLLTVEGIKNTPSLSWVIPINSLNSPSTSDTTVDSPLRVGDQWNHHGVIFYLERVELNSIEVNTKLYVRNETNSPIIFDPHYENGNFELIDNLGRNWLPVHGYTELVVLNPGQTSGDIGPRFDGSLLADHDVQQLTLHLNGLLDVQDARWVFELNLQPDNPKLSNTPTGKILTVGQPWRHNDLILRLDRVEIGSSDLNTKFYVTNKTDSVFVFGYGPTQDYFSLVDNKGREWTPQTIPEGREVLNPESTSSDIGPRFKGEYLDDPQVTYVILIVKNLFGVSEAQWKIDIVR